MRRDDSQRNGAPQAGVASHSEGMFRAARLDEKGLLAGWARAFLAEVGEPVGPTLNQNKMVAKSIVGRESLDDFDKFVTELRKLGSDEYEQIYKDAYAVYLRNLQ